MFTADGVSLWLMGASVAIAAVTAIVLVLRRARPDVNDTAEVVPLQPPEGSPAIAAAPPVSVRLVADTRAPNPRWEVEVLGTRASLDVFSYRCAASTSDWVHELLDAPVVMEPGAPARLPGPVANGTSGYVVAIGWSTLDGSLTSRQTSLVNVGEPG
jgi:hypothetical protein